MVVIALEIQIISVFVYQSTGNLFAKATLQFHNIFLRLIPYKYL